MKKKFKAIIFDLGGVLYDIDVQRSVKAFETLGLENFDELYSLQEQTEVFDKLETGKINVPDFVKHMQKHLPHISNSEKILDAWCALLIDMPQENIAILRQLREAYNLYLLSNTNEIHIAAINKYLQQYRDIENIKELFDKTYFSFEIGLRKPGVEIYKYVLQDCNINAADALFIDDNEDNIKGAQQAGIESVFKPRTIPLHQLLAENTII